MNKLGFSQQEMDNWKDKPVFLNGGKKTGVVLVHGWSAMPRQMESLAKAINDQGYPVSIPLLRGHGTFPEDLEQAKAEQWIEDVVSAVGEMRKKGNVSKVIAGGISMGGNLALLASTKEKIDGIVLIGTPVHLRNHFIVWLGAHIFGFMGRYLRKKYPKKILTTKQKETSYQYYPAVSVKECLKIIRHSVLALNKVFAPILVLQTDKDYLLAKYSLWVIYNGAGSKFKKMQWLKTKYDSHVLSRDEEADSFSIILNFIKDISEK